MKRIIVLGALLILFFNTIDCFAWDDDMPEHQRGHRMHRRERGLWFGDKVMLQEQFGLSAKQIERISKLNARHRDQMVVLRDKLRPKKRELRDELVKEKVNLAKVRKLLQDIAQIEVEIRYMRVTHRLELEKQLTQQQKKRMREERQRRRQRRHGRMMHD